MIVKMKKTKIISLAKDRDKVLDTLARLEIIHVEVHQTKDSPDRIDIEQKLSQIEAVLNALNAQKPAHRKQDIAHDFNEAPALFKKALTEMDKIANAEKKLNALLSAHEKLAPWGDFNQDSIKKLEKSHIFVQLCATNPETFKKIQETHTCKIIKNTKKMIYFAVISNKKLDEFELPVVSLPHDTSLSQVEKQIQLCEAEIKNAQRALADLKPQIKLLKEYKEELKSERDFLLARDSMSGNETLLCICGYVPEPKICELRKYAQENGWGLVIDDPSPEDHVPTQIKYPPFIKIVKPIFEFIGVSPGYNEWDVSACFLLFFAIFFAMIVSDAGYGLLFLATAFILKFKFKKNEALKLSLNLFIFLSCATIFWGALTGSFFSIPSNYLPKFMKGINAFTNPESKDKNIQLLCFILAATHLSFARLWKAFILRSIKSLGQIGWAFMIWANFFTISGLIVYEANIWKYTPVLYVIAGILLLLFFVDWKNLGEVFNFPFSIVGSFTDVLSYIRLYAVGLSSFYIAMNTNDLGGKLMSNPAIAVFGILLIFAGHLGNIIMSFLGVLVHGVRLNTLEFSNHMELQWKGFPYKPLSRNKTSDNL